MEEDDDDDDDGRVWWCPKAMGQHESSTWGN